MRVLLLLAVPLFAQTPCADMARLPDVTSAAQTATDCRVSITLRPSADSEIKSEVWLPAEASWNGKFLMEGGGGFVGSVNINGMTKAVREGYASASTDTGHTGGSGSFALGHPEKIVDFAFRAVHVTAVKAKALIAAYYGRGPRLSYWEGCSTGGRQGLMSAQRYPEDFDGIIAGAPAVDTTGRASFAIWIAQQQHRSPGAYIPADKYPAIHAAVLEVCDGLDGVTDGVLENPRACTFDPKVLECKAGDAVTCLTAAQVETARAMYKPLVNPRTGAMVFPGLERGSELGWSTFGGPQPLGLGVQMFQFMVFGDPAWDYKTLNFDQDMAKVAAIEQGRINVLAPDLSRFGARGGKLIHYHGWADQQIPSASSTRFFQSAESKVGGHSGFDGYYRMFMVPAMGHCGGGAGTTSFDMLTSLEQWVEHGKAPNAIPAARVVNGQVVRTRPLCPFPQTARYSGHGSTDDAANFSCAAP